MSHVSETNHSKFLIYLVSIFLFKNNGSLKISSFLPEQIVLNITFVDHIN